MNLSLWSHLYLKKKYEPLEPMEVHIIAVVTILVLNNKYKKKFNINNWRSET